MPARLRDIIQLCKQHGIACAHGGKHFKLEKPGFRPYTIPAHNGDKTEVSDVYIRAMKRHFGIT